MLKKILVNAITFFRIILSILFCSCALKYKKNISASLLIFLLVFITDYFDGKLARRLDAETKAGAFFDVTVDLFFIVTSYVTLISLGEIPKWSLGVIILKFAEFMITSRIAKINGNLCPSGLFYDKLGKIAIACFYGAPILTIALKIMLPGKTFWYAINGFLLLVTFMAGASSFWRIKACYSSISEEA